MDWFAALHAWGYFITLLAPFFLPASYAIYFYWYFVTLLTMWLVLDRCPLFFARETKLDDLIIHMGELGLMDNEDEFQVVVMRFISSIAPVVVIMMLNFYPTFTMIFGILNLLIFYRRFICAITALD